jgi:transcription elongation GreA/GreB family factor
VAEVVNLDKAVVIEALRASVADALARATAAQRETQRGATHEEAKPENDKDTRALEATYLARGLAERVVALESAVAQLAKYRPRRFGSDTPAALFALVTLEALDDGSRTHYLVVPAPGGLELAVGDQIVLTVTPQAPLGRALIGSFEGDEVTVQTPGGVRTLSIERVA